MRRTFVFFLWLFLLLFVIASLYISFTAYLKDRDRKILTNLSTFFLQAREGKSKVSLPFPDTTILVYAKRTGEKFVSSNALSSIDRAKYDLVQINLGKDKVYAYVKKIDPLDYLNFVGQNHLYTGLIVASVLLYLSIFYFTVKEFELAQSGGITEELMNRLKALRLTLATFKVIPEESVDEMKRVVDSILRHRSSKR